MLGLMMNWPLMISSLIRHADRYHGDTEIVSRTVEGPIHRYTYRDAARRARRLARALVRLGVRAGDRVGTLAWNGYRHFELYFAVSGMGAVIHTINPRLFHDQITYIVNHAEDRVLFFDLTFLPLVERLAPACHDASATLGGDDRSRAHAGVAASATCSATRICSPRRTTTSTGPSSTRTPRPRSATRRARRAIPRACSTATARRSCTPMRLSLPDAKGYSAHERGAADRADVPRQRLGHPLRRDHGRRQAGVCRARTRRRQPVRAVRERARDYVAGRADGLARPDQAPEAEQPQVLDA